MSPAYALRVGPAYALSTSVGGDLQQGLRGGSEENPVNTRGFCKGDRAYCFREREDHVKVAPGAVPLVDEMHQVRSDIGRPQLLR